MAAEIRVPPRDGALERKGYSLVLPKRHGRSVRQEPDAVGEEGEELPGSGVKIVTKRSWESVRIELRDEVGEADEPVGAGIDGAEPRQVVVSERRADGVGLVDGVRDEDGLTVASARLAVDTVNAPSVVRFRPAHKTTRVDRDQVVSVRFTKAMDRSSTKRAFTLTADGKPVDGKVSWAEDDTVLIFDPAKRLPYDAKIVATVAPTARNAPRSRAGTSAKSSSVNTDRNPSPILGSDATPRGPAAVAGDRPLSPRPARPVNAADNWTMVASSNKFGARP